MIINVLIFILIIKRFINVLYYHTLKLLLLLIIKNTL